MQAGYAPNPCPFDSRAWKTGEIFVHHHEFDLVGLAGQMQRLDQHHFRLEPRGHVSNDMFGNGGGYSFSFTETCPFFIRQIYCKLLDASLHADLNFGHGLVSQKAVEHLHFPTCITQNSRHLMQCLVAGGCEDGAGVACQVMHQHVQIFIPKQANNGRFHARNALK